jgi:hypothetical protein
MATEGQAQPDGIPVEPSGSPHNETGARLVRSMHTGRAIVKVWGAHVDGNTRAETGVIIADRAQLQSLITDLILIQQRWARES